MLHVFDWRCVLVAAASLLVCVDASSDALPLLAKGAAAAAGADNPYAGYKKVSLKLDCYLGMGFRAGGCDSLDLKNHEMRLANLETAGLKTHEHTKQIGKQVETLHGVAVEHQNLHETVFEKNRNVRPSVMHARAMLNRFPDAKPARLAADSAWKRVFQERILKPITLVDWAQIMVGVALVLIIVFKVYGYLRSRRRSGKQSVHIHTNGQSVSKQQPMVETV